MPKSRSKGVPFYCPKCKKDTDTTEGILSLNSGVLTGKCSTCGEQKRGQVKKSELEIVERPKQKAEKKTVKIKKTIKE